MYRRYGPLKECDSQDKLYWTMPLGNGEKKELTAETEAKTREVKIVLREVVLEDLPIFFSQQMDAEANHMAAFTSKDPTDWDAFQTHWNRILKDDTTVNRTILIDGKVIGHVASFEQLGNREVSYWLDRAYWGQGLATQALAELLRQFKVRPLFARAVKDNVASLRVLAKCGFTIVGEDKGFANARGTEVEEFVLILSGETSSIEGER